MNQSARGGSGDAGRKGPFRMGMKGLMGAVACCALVIWAGSSIRDQLKGYQPLRVIHSGNPIERKTAAQDLPHERAIDAEAAMAALIHTLGDEDAGVRAMAAQSLGSLFYRLRVRPPTPPIASDLLKRWIDVTTRELVPLLSDRDPGVRAGAAIGLGMMARGPDPILRNPEHLAALRGGSNAVRREAAKMIYGSPEVTLMPELVVALRDESAEVRTAAARAIKSFGPDLDPEIPALIAVMERDEANVRKACAEALEAAWPTPALVPTLIGFLKSRDHGGRYHAAQLLGRIGPEAKAAIPALISVLKEPFDGSYPFPPQKGAAQALGQMGPRPEVIAALLEVISPEKVEANLSAWQKVESLPAAGGGPATSSPPAVDVRVLSWESLRIMHAMQALGEIGPPAVAAVPALIAAYNKALETHHSMAQMAIPEALGRIAPSTAAAPDAVAALIHAIDSKQPFFRPEAIKALGHFGTDATAAIPRLRGLQQDPDKSVRDAAAKSLKAIEARSKPVR